MRVEDGSWGSGRLWRAGNFLLLSTSLLLVRVLADFSKDSHFSWKAGEWGRCVGEECGSGGLQTRTVWCVHSEGWNTHPSNCRALDRPPSQRSCFKVCEWHQDLFEWAVSEWGGCSLAPLHSNELMRCVTAQRGVQRRSVRCVRTVNGSEVTERICEFFSPRPALEQACLIPCPLDCVLSDLSPWSGCSTTCGPGVQHRTRRVLAAPMYGGSECPNLTQTRPCAHQPPCMDQGEHHYSLKVGPWSECRRPQDKDLYQSGRTTVDFRDTERNSVKRHVENNQSHHHHHQHHHHHHLQLHQHHLSPRALETEIGYQTRQVRCMASDGKNAVLSLCTQDESPGTYQSCVMPRDCRTSMWSEWSPCSKTCRASDLSPGYRLRTRTVTEPAIGRGRQCPVLEEKEACNIIGDILPRCPRFEWRSSAWGECSALPLLGRQERRMRDGRALCGRGIQTRHTYCTQITDHSSSTNHRRDSVSRPVSPDLCVGPVPAAVQFCTLPCPEPCLVSLWSSWGSCHHDNCLETQGRRGFRLRRRRVLGESSSDSEACPHLLEAVPCEDPVCFQWKVRSDGSCVPSDRTCGPGSRNQTVACVNSEGDPVGTEYCEEAPPPVQVACEVPCAGDCVVSSWSDWSTCSQSCTNKNAEGRQSRVRTILALPGEGGKPCPLARSLEQWRVCNDRPCAVFFWEVSPWGQCVEDFDSVMNSSSSLWNRTSSCSVGVQTRTVTCVKMTSGPVIPKRCPESARPDSARPCVLPCRRDCVVTPFSEWTPCPSSCLPVNATVPTQWRYRTIVQREDGEGQECPDTLFEERECDPPPLCPTYRWRTQRWQQCALVPESVRQGAAGAGESCGRGLETRALSCVNDHEELVPLAACIRWAGRMPPQVRRCSVPCKDDCTFSSWSKFTECSGCGSRRSRKRTLTGRSRRRLRCQREDVYPLTETEECPCEEFISQPWGNWSACILLMIPQGWRGQRGPKSQDCGQGVRYRAISCTDQRGHLLDPSLCSTSGLLDESCHVPCPLDCRLSAWSNWSPCSALCGSGLKVRSKWLREKPFNGGRPCPKLDLKNQVYEALPCRSVCGVYEWVTEPWSFCSINSVDQLPACGEGVQSRKIRCVLKGGDYSSVNESLCDADEMPLQAQTCVLPCHGDCVMSPWSHWSLCPTPCDSSKVRMRTRHVLRPPAADAVCPENNQTEPCVANTNCFTYQYNISGWSSCVLSENAVCGEGQRSRLPDCTRSDGRVLELSVCEELGVPQPWSLTESCEVSCPVSCVLSEWTMWTECSHTCGNQGVMSRSRRVLQEAHDEGRPCPSQLSQTKPCPVSPCYSWLLGDWTPCTVQGAECGDGVRERNLSCVVHWGHWPDSPGPKPGSTGPATMVEEEKCGERFRRESELELLQPCFVPCPGDCHLTEWSSWSSCQLTCLEGRSFESIGQQARSRAVVVQALENQDTCPSQVLETRPCKGGKCHSYEWRTSVWNNNERTVWCQRSDGVNVTGGCLLANKPAAVRHCHPPCTKPFSHCKQSGVCGCERGYTEVMTSHGFLDYCTRTPGGDNRKADVKTSSGRLKPGPSHIQDFFSEWSLQPLSPDGRIKMWVYGATAGGFILILFIIAVSFLLCGRPVKPSKNPCPQQKALSLAYDGDVDM